MIRTIREYEEVPHIYDYTDSEDERNLETLAAMRRWGGHKTIYT